MEVSGQHHSLVTSLLSKKPSVDLRIE